MLPTPSLPVVAVLCASTEPADLPSGLAALEGRVTLRCTDEAGLAEAVRGADALFLWDFFSSALRAVWDQADSLAWVHVAAAGVDTLVFDELAASEVVVTNARGTFDGPIAEYVLGAVLAHAKRTHESRALQRDGIWRHRETRRLAGSSAVVVGTGSIGREIARLLRAVGVEVTMAGRTARTDDAQLGTVIDSGHLAQHLSAMEPACDYLVNAAPLTSATRGLVNAAVLAALPATAHVVNIGRGESLVEEDLLAALEAGELDGATLDVVTTEPLPADSPLWQAPGLVLTAHMSGDVVGWKDALAAQFVDNAERWLTGRPLVNVVDTAAGYVPGPRA